MFGLFSSKTKKIEEKLSKLATEIASIQKNIIIYPEEFADLEKNYDNKFPIENILSFTVI